MTSSETGGHEERMRFLQRRFRAHRRPFRGPLPAIALLNLVLLVVMLFLFQSSFVLRPGVVINLPSSPFVSGLPYHARVITITKEGLIFFDDEQILPEALPSAFARMVYERPDAALAIEADGHVQHALIVQVYNIAMAVGVREVLLATSVGYTGGPP